jgi:hypothetical protein
VSLTEEQIRAIRAEFMRLMLDKVSKWETMNRQMAEVWRSHAFNGLVVLDEAFSNVRRGVDKLP